MLRDVKVLFLKRLFKPSQPPDFRIETDLGGLTCKRLQRRKILELPNSRLSRSRSPPDPAALHGTIAPLHRHGIMKIGLLTVQLISRPTLESPYYRYSNNSAVITPIRIIIAGAS